MLSGHDSLHSHECRQAASHMLWKCTGHRSFVMPWACYLLSRLFFGQDPKLLKKAFAAVILILCGDLYTAVVIVICVCQIGKIFTCLFPYGQCVFPLYALKYKWPLRSHNLISRQGTIPPFESKLSLYYSPRNRFTETPLIEPGAGTNLEACILLCQ